MPQQSNVITHLVHVFDDYRLTTSTPLIAAISDGNAGQVERLLNMGAKIDEACLAADLHEKRSVTLTPIQYAVALALFYNGKDSYVSISRLLFNRGAVSTAYEIKSVDQKDVDGLTPEHLIVKRLYFETKLMKDVIRANPDAFIDARASDWVDLQSVKTTSREYILFYLETVQAKPPSKSSWIALGEALGAWLWNDRGAHVRGEDYRRYEHENFKLLLVPLFEVVCRNFDALEAAKKRVIREACKDGTFTPRQIADEIASGVWKSRRNDGIFCYRLGHIHEMLLKLFEAEQVQSRMYKKLFKD